MLSWWIFEFIPMGIVALLPLIILPMLEVMTFKEVTISYADPILFMFLGGFMLARALEKTNISKVFAQFILRKFGSSPSGVQFSFLFSTAFLSMWISNTATTMMMIPIALSVLKSIEEFENPSELSMKKYQTSLLLIISYSASIGGLMTPIGTPPNMVFMGILKELTHLEIGFFQWILIAMPVGIFILLALYLLLNSPQFKSKLTFSMKMKHAIEDLSKQKILLNRDQKTTLAIFFMMVFGWIFRVPINIFIGKNLLDDSLIAIFGGLLFFLLPLSLLKSQSGEKSKPILNLDDVSILPWDVFLLFGGSLALASSLEKTGIINLMSSGFSHFEQFPQVFVFLIIIAITIILTEVMSNVALAAVAIPIVMTWAKSTQYSELAVGMMVALATSFGFSLPMSTPPNALVFGTGLITFKEMMKVGIILNVLSMFILLLIVLTWWKIIL